MSRKVLEYQDLLPVAVAAAERGAEFIRGAQRPTDPAAWTRKGPSDFVTEVDTTAERLITDYLKQQIPDSQVRGEELNPECDPESLVWIVDPLDGTTNYLHSYPAYAVSIAAVRDKQPLVGVVVDVPRRLTYTAVQGQGSWLAGSRLQVSSVADPAAALIGTGFPFKTPALLERYLVQFVSIMRETSGIRRAGSAALDLVDLALGRFEGFWELELAPWDVAAGTLLVREAGGIVTDVNGCDEVIKHGSIVAGNAPIHEWLLNRL